MWWLGLHLAISPAHQPQFNLNGLEHSLLPASGLLKSNWSHAMQFGANLLRHKALGLPQNVPAFGASGLKGTLGRLLHVDLRGDVTPMVMNLSMACVRNMCHQTVACLLNLRLSRMVGIAKLLRLAAQWKTIETRDCDALWLLLSD